MAGGVVVLLKKLRPRELHSRPTPKPDRRGLSVAAVRAEVAHRETSCTSFGTPSRVGSAVEGLAHADPHANSRRGLWHPCPPAGRAQFRLACSRVAVARCGRSRSGAVQAQPETLTANAEGARWRSNRYCAARSATRVVPHHAFHERDRGPGCRPVGIIDKAVDSNVRARSNIECGPIDELEICASLFVGVHQIVLCDRCANGGGRSVSEYARLNRSSPTDSLRRGRPTHGEADCEGNPKCPFLSEP